MHTRYINLKAKFVWPPASASPPLLVPRTTATVQGAGSASAGDCSAAEEVRALFTHIFPRLEMLVTRFLEVEALSTGDSGPLPPDSTAGRVQRCVTRCFVRQIGQTAHFLLLEGWLRGLVGILQRTVLPALAASTTSTATSTTAGSKKTSALEGKTKSTLVAETEKKLKNAAKFSFNSKRALNLANFTLLKKRKTRGAEGVTLPSSTCSSSSAGEEKGTSVSDCSHGSPFLSLASVLSAVKQQHSDVHWTVCTTTSAANSIPPATAISAGASASDSAVSGGAEGVPLSLHLRNVQLHVLTLLPEHEDTKCNINIAFDEQVIPLYVAIDVAANGVDDGFSNSAILNEQTNFSAVPHIPSIRHLRFERPEADNLLSIYQQMNEFLTTIRGTYDLSSHDSPSAQFNVLFHILSQFTAHFNLSTASCNSNSNSNAQLSPACRPGQLRVSLYTGHITVA